MNRFLLIALTAFGVLLQTDAATDDIIRSAAELKAATFGRGEIGRRFDITARLTTDCRAGEIAAFAVEDDTGAMQLWKAHVDWADKTFPAGTRVQAQGFIETGRRSKHAYAKCETLSSLSSGPAPHPVPVTAKEFLSGAYDCRLVTLRGTVRDIITDEIDPRYTYATVKVDDETISMPFSKSKIHGTALSIGTEIEVSGICSPTCLGVRRQLGRILSPSGDALRILSPARNDPFDAPLISDFLYLRPQDIAALGRHRARGRVVAAWHGDSALLMADDGRIVRIETDAGRAPSYGDCIEAVGFPESDLYHINLSRVVWRKLPSGTREDETPREVTAEALQTDEDGHRCFDPSFHGHAIRLSGIVRNLTDEGSGGNRFNIESGRFMVSVDASALPEPMRDLQVGCKVSVAGTCVMESDNWRPNLPFPVIRSFFVVVRRSSDVTVLSRPSWWTPPRLAAVAGLLAFVLLGSLVGNALLKRLAEQRGQELAKTAIAKAESDLKVDERTRLAVELHDTISQNLTGISLAIQAADRFSQSAPEGMRASLKLATSSLDSCRRELKNCLWDLRNNTLDETDMDKAIRQTLEPHIGTAKLHVRFSLPRERFTDKTAHAILCILRELATNAVRHGQATHIRIAGSLEDNTLRISVRDDGCGFDPANCPGMDAGHFGLQGVRERVNNLEGTLEIDSSPDKGTKATVILTLSHPSQSPPPNSSMKKNPIRILIADDHKIVRMGLAALLSTEPDLRLVGEAEDGMQVIRQAVELSPDVIIMDLMMPKKDGVEATREILSAVPGAKILILTSYGTSNAVGQALEAGASGALIKTADDAQIVTAIRKLLAGETYVSPEIKRSISDRPVIPTLSPRQTEVLKQLTLGHTNKEIANLLGIRTDGVEDHIKIIYEKLGATNRAEAVAIALRKHLLKI